jgi:hypothetical protein
LNRNALNINSMMPELRMRNQTMPFVFGSESNTSESQASRGAGFQRVCAVRRGYALSAGFPGHFVQKFAGKKSASGANVTCYQKTAPSVAQGAQVAHPWRASGLFPSLQHDTSKSALQIRKADRQDTVKVGAEGAAWRARRFTCEDSTAGHSGVA